jgi:hypothetical protein
LAKKEFLENRKCFRVQVQRCKVSDLKTPATKPRRGRPSKSGGRSSARVKKEPMLARFLQVLHPSINL